MDTEYTQAYVDMLLDYQFDVLYTRNCWGVNHAEFIFVRTLVFLDVHPELRSWLMGQIESTLFRNSELDNFVKRPAGFVPEDFIYFLVHATRWPEFETLAERLSKDPIDVWRNNPYKRSSVLLREALQDDWEDRDFYERFGGVNVFG